MSIAIVSIDDKNNFIVHAINSPEYLYNIAYCWCSQQYGRNNIKYHEELCGENDVLMKIGSDEIHIFKKKITNSWIFSSLELVFKRRFYLTTVSDQILNLPIPPPPPPTLEQEPEQTTANTIQKCDEFKNLSQSLMFELKNVIEKRKGR